MVYGYYALSLLRIAQPPGGLIVPRGAVVAFAFVGGMAFGGVMKRFGGGLGRVQLWGSFHLFSVGLAVGAAWLVGAYGPSFWGWPVGSFAVTAVYLSVVGAGNTTSELVGAGSGGDDQ